VVAATCLPRDSEDGQKVRLAKIGGTAALSWRSGTRGRPCSNPDGHVVAVRTGRSAAKISSRSNGAGRNPGPSTSCTEEQPARVSRYRKRRREAAGAVVNLALRAERLTEADELLRA